jgi:hypothetical protein
VVARQHPTRINQNEMNVKNALLITDVSNQVPALDGLVSKMKRRKEQLQKLHARMLKKNGTYLVQKLMFL